MKVFKYILNIIIWTVIAVYLLTILTFRIPSIQKYAGDRVAMALSNKLGTKVMVGNVNPGWLNRLVIDQVEIDDQQGETMLKANRLSIRVGIWPLLTDGIIDISTAQILGAQLKLYQATPDAKPNFQFALDSLASKEPKSDSRTNLHLGSLIVRHSMVAYDKLWLPTHRGQLDINHLRLTDISSHIIIKTLTNDSIHVVTKNMAFKEQSGLHIKRLAFQFEGGKTHSLLHQLELQLPHTTISLHQVEANYHTNDKKMDWRSLKYHGKLLPSHITLADIAPLLPALRNFESAISIESEVEGAADNLMVKRLRVGSTTGDIAIDCNGWMHQMTTASTWGVRIKELSLSAKTIDFISENLKGKHITLPTPLVRAGDIRISGEANGRKLQQIHAVQHVKTNAGNIQLQFAKEQNQSFQASIKTDGINLQSLLNDKHFGNMATNIKLSGSLAKQSFHVVANGHISQFDYNNYSYRNLQLDARYDKKNIEGHLTIDDPNIGLDVNGKCTLGNSNKDIQLKAAVLNFAPKSINLSDKWGDARFFADIEANISGSRVDNTQGNICINNFSMISSAESYELDQLQLQTGYDNGTHFIRLNSDFAHAEIYGSFDYHTLTKSFTNFLASQMPTLPGLPTIDRNTRNNFAIHATISKSDWLQQLLHFPLAIKQPITLDGFVNDKTRTINVQALAPEFYYDGKGYRDASLNIVTPGDTLACQLGLVKIMDNDDRFQVEMEAKAHDNHLNTTLRWDNQQTEKALRGTLNTIANFYTNDNGQHAANIHVKPSTINVHNTWWSVEPSHIVYAPKHIDINGFTIRHDDQHLIIDGTASTSANDEIYVSLNDIDIEYILELVNFHAVDFNGQATGRILASGVFSDKPKASAQIMVDQFKFEHGRMGMLNANVEWNDQQQQIDIHAIADDGQFADERKSKTYINGYVSPKNNFIDLAIRAQNTRIDFMHSFTKSFISHIEGSALGEVRLSGPLSTINIAGELVVNGEAHVKPTGCTYQLRNDTIRLVPDEITFASCPIYDIHGQRGIVNGGIHHQHLTNLTYDLYVDANNLLAYDFPDFGDDTFYGTVYGTGKVAIHGRPNETTIDMNVTPQRGSTFVYNVAQPDAIGNQEFIRWNAKSLTPTSSNPQKKQNTTDNPLEDRSDMRINFLINCTPDATLRLLMDSQTNDYITLNGNGVLRATWYNKGGFQMFGTYRVDHGTYGVTIQEIIKKDFTFQPGGTIIFAGDPYEATLNLQASHMVNGVSLSDLNVGKSFANTVRVNCLMNITGQPSQPIVDFDLDMPNVNTDEKQMVRSIINGQEEMNQQVLYLLGIGRFYPQGANNVDANDTQQSQTSLAMQSLLSGTLSSQINSLLKSVIKSNDWSFGANISTGDEGWNNAEYEGIVSGRMFNNRLLINGQFGYRDKAATANTSFIGDFDVQYLLVPNGNLALKVYNQTNDRYFTKSSLNTQGLGLIIKKDFTNLRDLFGIKKSKKKKKHSDKQKQK